MEAAKKLAGRAADKTRSTLNNINIASPDWFYDGGNKNSAPADADADADAESNPGWLSNFPSLSAPDTAAAAPVPAATPEGNTWFPGLLWDRKDENTDIESGSAGEGDGGEGCQPSLAPPA